MTYGEVDFSLNLQCVFVRYDTNYKIWLRNGRGKRRVPSVETQHYRAHMIKFPSRELNKAGVKRVEDLVVFFSKFFFGIFFTFGHSS